jgi:hypothetical protein
MKTDQNDSQGITREARDSSLYHPEYCLPPSAQGFDSDTAYPSIEILSEDPQTAHRDPSFAPRNIALYLQYNRRPIYTSAYYEFESNGAIVQYLFEPIGQALPNIVNSSAEWENMLRATFDRMLVGMPWGKPIVSVIGAPFVGNQYAGEDLDFVRVSWQKSFL